MPADTKAPQLRKKMQLATQCQCLQELDWLIEKRGNVPGGLVCTQSHQQRNYCCGESQVSVNNRCWRKVHTESDFHFEHLEVTKYFWNPLCVLCVQLFSKKQSERNGSPQRTDAERVQSGWQSNQGNQHTETREGRGKKKWALKHWQHFSFPFWFILSLRLCCRANTERKQKNQTLSITFKYVVVSCVNFILQFLFSLTEQSGLVIPRLSLSSTAYVNIVSEQAGTQHANVCQCQA